MITMTIDRDKPGDEFFPGKPRQLSPGSALANMLRWDCGHRSKVLEFSAGKLKLSRDVGFLPGQCIDITTYEGDRAKMAVLLRGLCYWLTLYGKGDYALQLYRLLFQGGQEAGWVYEPLTELIKGNACGKGLILLGLDMTDAVTVEYVTSARGWYLTDDQLCAVLELARETGMTAEQVVAECTPER